MIIVLTSTISFFTALHKAGKHMENSIVAAYVALLVGCLIQENQVKIIGLSTTFHIYDQGPVVQSVVSLMSSLRVISLTVLADSIYNI